MDMSKASERAFELIDTAAYANRQLSAVLEEMGEPAVKQTEAIVTAIKEAINNVPNCVVFDALAFALANILTPDGTYDRTEKTAILVTRVKAYVDVIGREEQMQ